MVHPQAFLQTVEGDVNNHTTLRSALREHSEDNGGDREIQQVWQNEKLIVNSVRSDAGDFVDMEVVFPESQAIKNVVVGASSAAGNKDEESRFFPSAKTSVVPSVVAIADTHNGRHTLTLQEDGAVRVWQLDQAALDHEVKLWKKMYNREDDLSTGSSLELKVDGSRVGDPSTPKTGLDAPKYGKDDPNNDPHVGGNTWAGGTGGSDTAGLGGRGPYRLDKGHPVHQVSQAKKDEVSAEAHAKAHAMAQEALAEKLREIDMTDREWETYQSYFTRVEHESAQLRATLANLESVAQERNWLRHQSSGELDDGKLVDGVAGERLVFKRRGVSDSPFQAPAGYQQEQEPKRMLFVMDVSGSMYRFNGQDSRLERMLETSLMIMESFAGFERELDYCIMGHSGDSPEIPFVEFGAPPKDRKERLRVLQKMVAHTQYCRSGDHTVEAVERGVQRVAALEGDDRFVFVVSDANLERTGAGYDYSAGTFSPEGRIFQVEYARKAVENSGTTIGIKCTDGIIMGVEKTLLSKMLVPGTHRRIYAIDRHIGLSMAGLVADGRQLVNRAREEALNYKKNYGCSIPPHLLSERMGQFVHYYTLYGSIRPFGTAIMLAGYDQDEKKTSLYMVEPSGVTYSYRGCALGKGQQSAKTEIEKYKIFDMTCREAMKYVAKILNTLHDEVRHPFELELSWICAESNWQHHLVPDNLRDEVNEWAVQSIKEDEMADDDDDDDE
ncbi:hypothetical protein BBJ29_000770 [Phytophthora kernoviae]|uniref:Proteasome alpha-type subunits domain-containing protein n=1 Tax=Phytophthora kernoviae TaxID=325452 RepID=A0A3F2RWR5_9STRA|nr:hypothetical protein BBJ29_000770 [Phytophthora kernoviae]RLN65748.1 hypothetical protein BBP00_00002673 [Phytophthora kernoviae]